MSRRPTNDVSRRFTVSGNVIDPLTAPSIWRRPQQQRQHENVTSSDVALDVPSPLNPLSITRPSPEGVYDSPATHRYRVYDTQRINIANDLQELTSPISSGSQFTSKRGRADNLYFSKPPKPTNVHSRYPLRTIDQHGMVHVVMTPEHYNLHFLGNQPPTRTLDSLSRPSTKTSHSDTATHPTLPERKNTTLTALKDLSKISQINDSVRHEQPSTVCAATDNFHSTFAYPLHSTMNQPQASIIRNNTHFLNEQDISSIVPSTGA